MKRTRTIVAVVAALAIMLSTVGITTVAQHGQGPMGTPGAGMMGECPNGTPGAGMGHGHAGECPNATPADGMHGMNASTSMGAFYMTITNNGDQADRLVAVESPAAEIVQIHNVEMDGNVMQMIEQKDGVEIAAGETLELAPGGYHIMLIGLTDSLLAGNEFTATLVFENAGEVEITVPVLMTEPEEDELTAEPVEAGDLTINGIWARQAPKLDGGMGTPEASPMAGTPESTPAS